MFIKKDLRKIPEILEEASGGDGVGNDDDDDAPPTVKSLHLAKRKDEFADGRVRCLTEPSSEASRRLLSMVESLSLYDCGIRDVSGLGTCVGSLKDLSLGRNPELNDLPPDFGRLSNLERLWLDDCGLSILPSCVMELSNVRELRISNNRIESLPVDLAAKLADLEVLCADNNLLEELPEALPPSLRTLQVRENRLERLPPLPGTLRLLHASSNRIADVRRGTEPLLELTHAYLNGNRLAHVPHVFLEGCHQLKRLNLCHNRISRLSDEFRAQHGDPDPNGVCDNSVVWLGSNPVLGGDNVDLMGEDNNNKCDGTTEAGTSAPAVSALAADAMETEFLEPAGAATSQAFATSSLVGNDPNALVMAS
jgi:Leucine-rich repeat (LRR) protein